MKTQESFELYQNNPNNYISFLNGLSLIKQQICVFFYTSDVNFMLMLKWVFYSSNVLCYELYLSFEARRQPWPRPKRHPRAVIAQRVTHTERFDWMRDEDSVRLTKPGCLAIQVGPHFKYKCFV